MKKVIMIAVASLSLMAAGVAESSAQIRFGVMGGATFSKMSKEVIKGENMTQFHAGGTVQLRLPLGFSLQPSLIYNVKGSRFGLIDDPVTPTGNLTVGYLELPVSVQWGPDLLLFRPFLDVTPYVGYGLNNKITVAGIDAVKNSWSESGINRWEYGLGVGIGLEVWKFQVIGRYNWNFGSLMNFRSDIEEGVGTALKNTVERGKFGGFTLTAAFLF